MLAYPAFINSFPNTFACSNIKGGKSSQTCFPNTQETAAILVPQPPNFISSYFYLACHVAKLLFQNWYILTGIALTVAAKKPISLQRNSIFQPTYVVSSVLLILAIIPKEGSILAYMVDITPTTTISQLDGLAG